MKDISDETGFYIVGIDNLEYTIPPDARLNAIMVPIAFLLLLVVVIVAISCYCWK